MFSYLMVWWAHQVSELNPASSGPKGTFSPLQGEGPVSRQWWGSSEFVGPTLFVKAQKLTLYSGECSIFKCGSCLTVTLQPDIEGHSRADPANHCLLAFFQAFSVTHALLPSTWWCCAHLWEQAQFCLLLGILSVFLRVPVAFLFYLGSLVISFSLSLGWE